MQLSSAPEMKLLAQLDCLHSLCLAVAVQHAGAQSLAPLSALASLTQLRELTLEVSGGDTRRYIHQLKADEVFDLTWLDQLTSLRYLHIKAARHTSLATLRALGLLPPPTPPPTPHNSPPPPPFTVPLFVSRVEEFGLDLYAAAIGLERAGEFVFHAWTRLRRCAVHYMTLTAVMSHSSTERLCITPACAAANAVLRERVGTARWVSEEQLVSGRWDARWKQEKGA